MSSLLHSTISFLQEIERKKRVYHIQLYESNLVYFISNFFVFVLIIRHAWPIHNQC